MLAALLPESLGAAGPLQDDDASVDIYDKECTFWLDFDDDGEGDEEIDTDPGSYARQETPVVGSCEFKLNSPAAATLLLQTELVEWRSEVEIVREPGLPERKVLQPGRVVIPELEGGMKITVEHRGLTPRSVKSRALRDDYKHEVQVPRPFRLLEIIVTTPAGEYDRLEENASSASNAYIQTHQRISDLNIGDEATGPANITALAGELLDDGYPQIADRLLDVEIESPDGTNWWKWIAIGVITMAVIAIAAIGAIVWQSRRNSSTEPPPPSTRERGNM